MTPAEIHKLFDPLYDGLDTKDDFPAKRPLLAHYTSLSSLEKIFATDELWFSNPLLMNDLDEVRFGILRGAELVYRDRKLAQTCGSAARTRAFRDAFESFYRRFESQHAFDTYVFCLSEHSPSDFDGPLSMWRGYGRNGNGAALVFDSSKIDAVEESPLIIARVHYGTDEERIEWLKGLLAKCASILEQSSIPDNQIYIAANALFERIKIFALFSKHRGFSEEKEWRVVYAPDRDEGNQLAPMLHYSIGPRGAEPQLRFKVGPIDRLTGSELSLTRIVERIILGPTISSPMARGAVLRMLDRLGKSQLKDRVHSSSIPFRQT